MDSLRGLLQRSEVASETEAEPRAQLPDIASALDRLALCSAPSEVEGSSRRLTAGTRPMLVGSLDAAQKRLALKLRGEEGPLRGPGEHFKPMARGWGRRGRGR